jgi:mannose-6-phosphate isomerase
MSKLYPLKFRPILKEKVWGGSRLHSLFDKGLPDSHRCGESWEISTLHGNVSTVCNGFLEGNGLGELIEVYMGDLVGEAVFETFGNQLPLLVKFIDSTESLSVQVHPGDHHFPGGQAGRGKSEMWYVVAAEPGARIFVGFNRELDPGAFFKHLEEKTIPQVLNTEQVSAGDVFFIPAGRIHAIGGGVTLCEIQQPADITYRVYDWDRRGLDGNPRALHIAEAMEVLDFRLESSYKTDYRMPDNGSVTLHASPPFTVNLLSFDRKISSDFYFLDSCVVYVCLEGAFTLQYPGGTESVRNGEALLLPAEIKTVELLPEGSCKVLESYMA